jgi:DNA topoisomerase-6 subunit A
VNRLIRRIETEGGKIRDKILRRQKPSMRFPLRSLSNVRFDPRTGFFEMGRKTKERTLSVSTVKTFAQSLKMIALSKTLIETDDIATKREAYYVAKGWSEEIRFAEQVESDTVLEDVESLFLVNREQLGFVPEEKGGEVAGNLMVVDRDRDSGEELEIDCTRFGSGAYSIPISVEELRFESDARFVLAIETAGMFQRLVKHNFWRAAQCILVSMGGVPTRATRRFIRRLSDDLGIPVYAFVDCDPYGICNIYRTLKVGSGNAAHINEFFCVPRARFLGVTPDDIRRYGLPTHRMTEVDIKRIDDALRNDPFVQHYKRWQKALSALRKSGYRAEQQAFAVHNLNHVISTYLPEKLEDPNTFLP